MPVGPTQVPRGAQKHVGPKPGAVRAKNRKGGWKAQLRSPTFKPGYEIPLFNETGHGFDKERFDGGAVSWKDLPTAQRGTSSLQWGAREQARGARERTRGARERTRSTCERWADLWQISNCNS